MRHLNKGRKLGRTASHRKATMVALATALFEHKKIHTTEAKAKELRGYAEKLITKAKRALQREQQGLIPQGQTIDLHARRIVGKLIKKKPVLQELFEDIAPTCETRNGGYTRVIKTSFRRGDNAPMAIIELVDYGAPQDGNVSLKGKKKKAVKKPAVPLAVKPEAQVEKLAEATEELVEKAADTTEEVVDTVVETAEEAVEAVKEVVEENVEAVKEIIQPLDETDAPQTSSDDTTSEDKKEEEKKSE